jgi:putative endonuclease
MVGTREPGSATSGRSAEDFALNWLQQRGLRLVERNFRCRFGEIDLVMCDGAALAFVEVRMRRSAAFGGAAGSVTPAKLRRLAAAAEFYLKCRGRVRPQARIDVLALEGGTPSRPLRVDWYRGVTD